MNTQSSGNPSINLSNSTQGSLRNTMQALDNLINQVRKDIAQVQEPKAQALFETTAEVLIGLRKAYEDYGRGDEKAWQ